MKVHVKKIELFSTEDFARLMVRPSMVSSNILAKSLFSLNPSDKESSDKEVGNCLEDENW